MTPTEAARLDLLEAKIEGLVEESSKVSGLRTLIDQFKKSLTVQKDFVKQLEAALEAKDVVIHALERQVKELRHLVDSLEKEAELGATERLAKFDLRKARQKLARSDRKCKELGIDTS